MTNILSLEERIQLLVKLGKYMLSGDDQWSGVKHRAFLENNWFIPEFIDLSVTNIVQEFLNEQNLRRLASDYDLPAHSNSIAKIGVVMAGNIPLVGFHDLLAVFITGHYSYIKPSSKDEVMIKHLVEKLASWDERIHTYINIQLLLKNCDAYIATGSNTSSAIFEYYFRDIPSIIRRNRTSVAVLNGNESARQLEKLADDVYQFFGLGCRNVTKIFVPRRYEFLPLLDAFKKYNYLIDHNKYKNNYDYNLAIHLLNNKYYMTNGSILLIEDPSPFSPISQLNYEFYDDKTDLVSLLNNNNNIQCIVGDDYLPFGKAQSPGICHWADGVDTITFLESVTREVRREP